MHYSDSQFVRLARSGMGSVKPQFSELITVDFYDGIESGFGCYANGETVKISSLADSSSRIFRAFEFSVFDERWADRIFRISNESYEYAKQLVSEISSVVPIACFVGVAPLNIDWIKLLEVSADALTALRNRKRSEKEIYQEVHRLVKSGHSGPMSKRQ